MKRTKEMKKEWIAELKKMQKSYQGEISPDDLPFDLTAELGEVVAVELKSPGVYYIATQKEGDSPDYPEVYVVTADAPAISEKARTYGQEFPGHPDLRVYDILQPKSGRYIIDFEMRRYQIKCHLPEIEDEDSLYTAALYGAEEHPDYFGAFPVPSLTPRGFTVRHKTILNGVYWLETDRCEEMLAVCYPIWKSDISIPEQNQGEQLEYDRIFPLWLNWKYIRELFIMPNGLCEKGTQEAAAVYYEHILLYPYQMYIHWSPSDQGNILFNDKRFVSLLYRWHNDEFTEYNKVSDAGSYIKDSIYDFIDDSQKVVIVVDCENSDPYKLSATLRRLNSTYTEKITSIILFDDIHTASAWSSLEKFTSVSVEHILIERIKQNKSLVDIRLTARACQEYYENNVDSFIIVSSDSDYWGLISSLPKAQFLVMIEHNKCGPDMKAALANSGIFYCYLDDFYSGDSEELKTNALLQEMRDYMEKAVQLNAIDMLNDALRSTRIEMTAAERQQFYDKYIKTLQLSINDDGKVSLVIKVK